MGYIGGEAVFEDEGTLEFVLEEGSLKHFLDYLLIADRLGLWMHLFDWVPVVIYIELSCVVLYYEDEHN